LVGVVVVAYTFGASGGATVTFASGQSGSSVTVVDGNDTSAHINQLIP
jgi:hypothetical protein